MALTGLTKEAARFWNAIPADARAQLLANVYCARCGGSVSITNITGAMKGGDLILKGNCAKCGHDVARLVEGPDE